MTPWVAPEPARSAWHRRFPDSPRPWTGRVRLWRIELAVRSSDSVVSKWTDRADQLGLPASAVAAVRSHVERTTFAFLELPGGLHCIPTPAAEFPEWPEPITAVPAEVLHPDGAIPFDGRWQTVPVVRAEAACLMAGLRGDQVELYAVDEAATVSDEPLAVLPATALYAKTASQEGTTDQPGA